MVEESKIRLSDIEDKLRKIDGRVTSTIDNASSSINSLGKASVGVAILLVVLAYFFGKRRGRIRSTIVEIRRS